MNHCTCIWICMCFTTVLLGFVKKFQTSTKQWPPSSDVTFLRSSEVHAFIGQTHWPDARWNKKQHRYCKHPKLYGSSVKQKKRYFAECSSCSFPHSGNWCSKYLAPKKQLIPILLKSFDRLIHKTLYGNTAWLFCKSSLFRFFTTNTILYKWMVSTLFSSQLKLKLT